MINDEASEKEFGGVHGPIAMKRQHISQDPQEQRNAEQQRMIKMFEPILEEKMAEQKKSHEAMLERFKDSMLEKIYE